MSKIEKANAIIVISILFFCGLSEAQQMYAAVDIGQQVSGFKKGYGQEIFERAAPFVEVQFGKIFGDNWGIEVGLSTIINKKQKSNLIGEKDTLPGHALTPGFNHTTQSEIHHQNFYVGLINLYPFNEKLSLFSVVALSHTYLRNEYRPIMLDNARLTLSQQATLARTFNTHGTTIICKLGAKYKLTNNFGIKASFSWENTSKFKTKASQSLRLSDVVKHKNTSKIGIGFYINT